MEKVTAQKHGYRKDQAAEALGSVELFRECVAAGWLVPVVKRKRLTIYDGADIATCWAKIRKGDVPPPLPRKTK